MNPEILNAAEGRVPACDLQVFKFLGVADLCDFCRGVEVPERDVFPAGLCPEGIELRDGRYVRTYSVKEVQPAPHSEPVDESLEARYERLEKAFLDLAQMVSNLEDYRMLYEREREEEANQNPEENAE